MGRGIALQFLTPLVGMKLVAIANRTLPTRREPPPGRIDSVTTVGTVAQLESSIDSGRFAITENAILLCEAGNIDVVIEATGEIELAPSGDEGDRNGSMSS